MMLKDPLNSPKITALMEYLYISLSSSLDSLDALHKLDESEASLNPYARSKLSAAVKLLKNLQALGVSPVLDFVSGLDKSSLTLREREGSKSVDISGITIDYVQPSYSRIWDGLVETFTLASPYHEKVYAFRRSQDEPDYEIPQDAFNRVNLKNVLCYAPLNRLKAAPYMQLQRAQEKIDWQKDLNFLRLNLSDALRICNSLKLDDFVLDPCREDLGIYFIASAKLTKVDIVPFVGEAFQFSVEDHLAKKFDLQINSRVYWEYAQTSRFGRVHPEKFIETCGQFFDFFCSLGYTQRTPTVLAMAPIESQKLEINSNFAHIRFKKRVSSNEIKNREYLELTYPNRTVENQGVTYYIPHCIDDPNAFLSYILDKCEGTNKRTRDYIFYLENLWHFFSVNSGLGDIYTGKVEITKLYYPIEAIRKEINIRLKSTQIDEVETKIEQDVGFEVGCKITKQEASELMKLLHPPNSLRIVVDEFDSPNLRFLELDKGIQNCRPKCVTVSAYLDGRKIAVDTVNLLLKRYPKANIFSYTRSNGDISLIVHLLR